MLNMLGQHKIYTVPEIDVLLRKASGFTIVDTLPDISLANDKLVYYKRQFDEDGNLKKVEVEGEERPVLIPYLVGYDIDGTTKVWYTSGGAGVSDYEKLSNLPSINGVTFLKDMDEDKARAPTNPENPEDPSGYDLSLHDEDILDILAQNMSVNQDDTYPIGH